MAPTMSRAATRIDRDDDAPRLSWLPGFVPGRFAHPLAPAQVHATMTRVRLTVISARPADPDTYALSASSDLRIDQTRE
jgi:hypothetical protein